MLFCRSHCLARPLVHPVCSLSHNRSPVAIDRRTSEFSTGTPTPKLFLEDLQAEQTWSSDAREITGDDVADFAALTGDTDPLHGDGGDLDSPFGRPIAHGLLGLSVMAGLSSDFPRVATLALVEVSDWRFEAPIYFGDVVRVQTTVRSISPHGRRAGRVVWFRRLINQNDRVVQSGQIVSLVARRSRLSRPSSGTDPIANGTIADDNLVAARPKSPR